MATARCNIKGETKGKMKEENSDVCRSVSRLVRLAERGATVGTTSLSQREAEEDAQREEEDGTQDAQAGEVILEDADSATHRRVLVSKDCIKAISSKRDFTVLICTLICSALNGSCHSKQPHTLFHSNNKTSLYLNVSCAQH